MRVLGVIPARAGSKSIPHKNTATLCGRPLIEYTLDAAFSSSQLYRIAVSTDCELVKEIAAKYPADIIHRPEHLGRDDTPMIQVVQHALSMSTPPYLGSVECDAVFDAVIVLHPTCPMRRADDIDQAILQMQTSGASSVISYVDVGANHCARMVTIVDETPMPLWYRGSQFLRKQDLPPHYIRSGDMYLTRVEHLLKGDLVGDKPRAYLIEPERHCNIDGPRDLKVAELLMEEQCLSVAK